MRALVLHGPGRYKIENDWPDPAPKPGWVKVAVRFAGICGSDLPRFATAGSYHHPMILGHEFSGVVDTPAPGSSERVRPGQKVAVLPIIPCGNCEGCTTGQPFHCNNYQFLGSRNDGGFAEYCLVPEQNLFALPEQADLRVGAFIEPLAVALHAVRRSGFRPGQSAIVYGAGTIGILIALWLGVFGASRVVCADIRPESLETARSAGIAETLNAREQSSILPASGFDAAFEAASSAAAFLSALDVVGSNGRLTVVGRDLADTTIPHSSFELMMRKEIDIRGCWGYNLNGEEAFFSEMLRRKSFPVAKLVSHEVGLEEAPQLIGRMVGKEMYFCKAMVRIGCDNG